MAAPEVLNAVASKGIPADRPNAAAALGTPVPGRHGEEPPSHGSASQLRPTLVRRVLTGVQQLLVPSPMARIGLFFLATDAPAVVSVLARLGACEPDRAPTELKDYLVPYFPDDFRVAVRQLRAHAEAQAEVARVKERLARQRERELQSARLEARAKVAWCRWKELDAVVDAAERRVQSLRDTEPERYVTALRRFLDSARGLLAGRALTVRAHPADLARLQHVGGRARDSSETIQVADAGIQAGLLVTSTDGNVLIDETMASRRKRLDEMLRLLAAEVLFGTSTQDSGRAQWSVSQIRRGTEGAEAPGWQGATTEDIGNI